MEVIKEWGPTFKSECDSAGLSLSIPGLDMLKAYGDIDEPCYSASETFALLGFDQRKINVTMGGLDEGDDYKVIDGQKYLTLEGIIVLISSHKTTATKYLRKVITNCVKILRKKYPKILEEVLEKTKAENVQLHATFQAEIASLYDQVNFITHAKHELEDDLEETKTAMQAKEAEVTELRNRERALMGKVIQSHVEDLREPDKLLLDGLVAAHAKRLYVYNTAEPDNLYISDRENKSRELVEIIPLINTDEYRQLIAELTCCRCEDGSYTINIEDLKEIVANMRRKEADIKALNACSAYLYTGSGQDFIDRHVN